VEKPTERMLRADMPMILGSRNSGYNQACEDWQEYLSHKEKEIERLRNYCTLTFGESHPEIKKCVHEEEIERLRGALEYFYHAVRSFASSGTNGDCEGNPRDYHLNRGCKKAEQALGGSDD